MATIGITTQPSGTTGTAANVIMLTRIQADISTVITLINGYLNSANASYAENIFCIYNGTALEPTTLLAKSTAFFGLPDSTMGLRTAAPATTANVDDLDYYWVGAQIKHDSTLMSSEADVTGATAAYYGASGFNDTPDLTGLTTPSFGARFGFYLEYDDAPAYSLDQVAAGSIQVGGTGYAGLTTGMGVITSLTFAGKTATITAASVGSFTWDMPPFQHGVTYPAMGVRTYTAGDGTLTADKDSTVNTMDGYTAVTMGTMDTGEWSIGKDPAIVTGDVVHLPDDAGTLNTDGTLTDYVFGTYTMWRRDVSDGKMYTSQLTVTEEGVTTGSASRMMSNLIFFL